MPEQEHENSRPWKVTFLVYRQKSTEPSHLDSFTIDVDPDEYVLDGIERIWAFHDRSLTFRHACHHSTCGACGMRVDTREKLSCITSIRSVVSDGGTITVEPMRNFPVVSDLVVDMGTFFARMEQIGLPPVLPLEDVPPSGSHGIQPDSQAPPALERLVDCIECGLCISACPISTTSPAYLGPAILAAAQQKGVHQNPQLLQLVDNGDGAWRCHSVYECTAVCPSNVEPAWRIMDLRKQVVVERLWQLSHRDGDSLTKS